MSSTRPLHTVLAIDPGRSKCGIAVLSRSDDSEFPKDDPNDGPRVLYRGVVQTPDAVYKVSELQEEFHPDVVIIGNGTTSSDLQRDLTEANIAPIEVVDEKYTTVLARRLYFYENPPRGLRRLIPISLQTPPNPYDDYVAIILARRRFEAAQH